MLTCWWVAFFIAALPMLLYAKQKKGEKVQVMLSDH
jgi:hypothetical protein